jgi:hypothetical protein
MNNAPVNANPQPVTPTKQAILQCVCKNGQIIIRQATPGTEPPQKLLQPMNLNADPRLFVKNGEIVRPFVVFTFKFRRTIDVSGVDISLYSEVSVAEFDPSDMVPIAMRSLDKDFDELNAPPKQEAA